MIAGTMVAQEGDCRLVGSVDSVVPAGRGQRGASRLVGREAERAVLSGWLDEAAGGAGRVGVVLGEAGIGKSRLLDALAAEASDRAMEVLRGRAVHATAPVAYRPLSEALRALVRAGRAPSRRDLAPFDQFLGALMPEWSGPDAGPLEHSVLTIAEAVLRFLHAAAKGEAKRPGCLLVLEDLHWVDDETLAVVEYFADNVAGERLLIAASWRTDEPSDRAESLRRLIDSRTVWSVALNRLDAAAVAAMVASWLDTSSVGDDVLALVAPADGVPFLIEEVLATALASGRLAVDRGRWTVDGSAPVMPPTFVEDVALRLRQAGPDGRAVVIAGALLGHRFEWHLVPRVAALGDDEAFAGLRAAVDLRLVEADPDPAFLRFRHDLSRAAVLANALPPERATTAARAVAAIEALHPDLQGEWCERAAALAFDAGDHERAPGLLLEAGRRAQAAGALLTAAAALENGLRVVRPTDGVAADLEDCLLDVASAMGDRDRSEAVGRSLLGRLGAPGNGIRRVRAHVRLARVAVAASAWDDADQHIAAARSDTPDGDEPLHAEVDAVEALAIVGRGEPVPAAAVGERAREAATRLGLAGVACEALEVLGRCARTDDLDAAERSFTQAVELAERAGLTVWRLRALHELGTIDMLRTGDPERLTAARELATEAGALATGALIDIQLCGVLVAHDDPEPAVVVARRAGDIARRLSLGATLAVALGFEANAHARAGRAEATERCLAEAAEHAAGDPSAAVFAACARTVLALLDDDAGAALAQTEGVAHDARFFSPLIGWWVLLRALDPEAGAAAVDAVRSAGEPAHYLARPHVVYAEAVVLGRAGDVEAAAAKVDQADAELERFEWYRQVARRHLAEAALTDGWGDPVGWARTALAHFEGWGHERLAFGCRGVLRRAGAPVPRRGRGSAEVPPVLGALGVTSREVDVLALVAAGLSNREVAERLVLSVRTIENHVERLLAKTGSPGRAALADVAARAGVV